MDKVSNQAVLNDYETYHVKAMGMQEILLKAGYPKTYNETMWTWFWFSSALLSHTKQRESEENFWGNLSRSVMSLPYKIGKDLQNTLPIY